MQFSGGVVILQAQLDSYKDTLHFIFDTGSGGISLDSSTVDRLQLPHVKTDRIIRGIAGMKQVEFVYKRSLKLPGLTVDSLDFHINDYTILTSVYGMKIDGIIGFSFLRRYIVKLDYENNMMEVFQPGYYKYPKGGYMLKPSFNYIPIQTLEVEDGESIISRFYFDTGAGMNLLLSKDFVEDSTFLGKKRKQYLVQAEGLGGKKLMSMTVIKSVKLGPFKFRKVPVYIFDDEFNATSYPQVSGLIGNELLRRFNVVLNYPDQSIYLKPNKHFSDPFDYSYTGLNIYMVDKEIKVEEVMKNSPAEKAGFMVGDVIFGVDNNFSNNIQLYKTLLQNTGNDVKVLLVRNGTPVVLTLTVKSILR